MGKPEALESLLRLPESGLAVVGTRHPHPLSVRFARSELTKLAGSGLIIVSGLARGIDASAHEAALEAGLLTVAVLGCGLQVPYPRATLELRRRILQAGGLLVSELDPLAEPLKSHFLSRNRIIAGWARATWVVEAPLRSGALNTAKWARDHHRSCYATPCFPGNRTLAGNQGLIDRHHAEPFWGIRSLSSTWLELYDWPPRPKGRRKSSDPEAPLLEKIRVCSQEKGGAQLSELLDWAFQNGYSAESFFNALHSEFDAGRITDRAGVLLSP